jgi:hypothetical protein
MSKWNFVAMGQVGLTGWTREVAKPVARSIARRTGRPEAEILSLIGAAFLAVTLIDFIRNVDAVIAAGRTGRQPAKQGNWDVRRQRPGPGGPGQEHLATAAQPRESPVTEAVRSLEVRWIFPGQLEAAVARWFGRFPARTESREDTYLLDPPLPGLSVKIRGGGALEVKAYRGSPGFLAVAGRARGHIESWQKWSFPFSPFSHDSGDPASWRPVRKRRRISWFSLASGQIVAPVRGLGQEPGCEVELTEVHTRGQDWWTLGFEATGPASLLRSELQAAAALVFAQALPDGMEPGPDESRSYTQ